MVAFCLSVLVLVAFLASLYGWGRLVFRPLYGDGVRGWPYFVVLGLTVWIFIGGILNVANLAYPVAIYTVFGLGFVWLLLAAFIPPWKGRRTITSSVDVPSVMPGSPSW